MFLLFYASGKMHYLQDGLDLSLDQILWPDDGICPDQPFSLGTNELLQKIRKEQKRKKDITRGAFFKLTWAKQMEVFTCVLYEILKSKNVKSHLTSLVVLTSSAFLLMELTKVLTSDRWISQRTKYSRAWRLSLSFRHGRVSKWWILASNV